MARRRHRLAARVFTVSLSDLSSGNYTFNLLKHLDHPAGNSENDITLSFGYQATDADGDVTAASTFTVTVNDDLPVTTGAVTAATVLDDDAFAGGNAGRRRRCHYATSATGAAGALFSVGADGFEERDAWDDDGIQCDLQGCQRRCSPGIRHVGIGKCIGWRDHLDRDRCRQWRHRGNAGDWRNGSYTFTTSRPLVHPTAGANEENLSLTFNYTVTDGDNDPATGSLDG